MMPVSLRKARKTILRTIQGPVADQGQVGAMMRAQVACS